MAVSSSFRCRATPHFRRLRRHLVVRLRCQHLWLARGLLCVGLVSAAEYIDQCATDSGYVFTAASIPDQDTVEKMCASSACQNLLADVQAMGRSECVIPVGDNILLLADLVDYVLPGVVHGLDHEQHVDLHDCCEHYHFVRELGFDTNGHLGCYCVVYKLHE
ncbi:elicitin-like protein [Phytophthora infestans T30-4]|uniref:Elicitin n=1 Tax=Phytophthora infestans (strain T30-4) TaxID=403677 RepID=D0NUA8_PHYIT|nr:elicitin-like protein [Phytophthora infestans T30-4]EEY65241.1 elicitin-like protein [Phytophthora infestans T30-4]|eukprot:XP_002897305.1 elicitin-like protein [Phytophthora infestans T30-4]